MKVPTMNYIPFYYNFESVWKKLFRNDKRLGEYAHNKQETLESASLYCVTNSHSLFHIKMIMNPLACKSLLVKQIRSPAFSVWQSPISLAINCETAR